MRVKLLYKQWIKNIGAVSLFFLLVHVLLVSRIIIPAFKSP